AASLERAGSFHERTRSWAVFNQRDGCTGSLRRSVAPHHMTDRGDRSFHDKLARRCPASGDSTRMLQNGLNEDALANPAKHVASRPGPTPPINALARTAREKK